MDIGGVMEIKQNEFGQFRKATNSELNMIGKKCVNCCTLCLFKNYNPDCLECKHCNDFLDTDEFYINDKGESHE